MLLAIDAGNTNIVLGLFANNTSNELLGRWRYATDASTTEDQYYAFLSPLLQQCSAKVTAVIISTVVPALKHPLTMLARKYFKLTPLIIGEENFKHDLSIQIESPQKLGADFIADTVGALALFDCDNLVVDLGTATTFAVSTKDRKFLGGAIAPGIAITLQALHNNTAQLPLVAFNKPSKVIGDNTINCMQSGIYYGYVGLIREIIVRMKMEYALPLKVIATGGFAEHIKDVVPEIDHTVADLTLIGLRYLYNYNNMEN